MSHNIFMNIDDNSREYLLEYLQKQVKFVEEGELLYDIMSKIIGLSKKNIGVVKMFCESQLGEVKLELKPEYLPD